MLVNAEDLRIGNLVYKKGKCITVRNICDIGINFEVDTYGHCDQIYWTLYNEISPIGITEEWLKKFGFFKYNSAWVLKEPTTNMLEFNFSIWEDFSYNTGEIKPPLEFVHQLQNLYFTLTGAELTLKV